MIQINKIKKSLASLIRITFLRIVVPRIAKLIIANKPAIGAIERGKKGAADAAHAHAIPKAFAFPDALCKLFSTRI